MVGFAARLAATMSVAASLATKVVANQEPCEQLCSQPPAVRAASIKLALRACVLASNKLALQRLKKRRNAPRPSKRDLGTQTELDLTSVYSSVARCVIDS